jgi:hypothetical protein
VKVSGSILRVAEFTLLLIETIRRRAEKLVFHGIKGEFFCRLLPELVVSQSVSLEQTVKSKEQRAKSEGQRAESETRQQDH